MPWKLRSTTERKLLQANQNVHTIHKSTTKILNGQTCFLRFKINKKIDTNRKKQYCWQWLVRRLAHKPHNQQSIRKKPASFTCSGDAEFYTAAERAGLVRGGGDRAGTPARVCKVINSQCVEDPRSHAYHRGGGQWYKTVQSSSILVLSFLSNIKRNL